MKFAIAFCLAFTFALSSTVQAWPRPIVSRQVIVQRQVVRQSFAPRAFAVRPQFVRPQVFVVPSYPVFQSGFDFGGGFGGGFSSQSFSSQSFNFGGSSGFSSGGCQMFFGN